MTARAARVGAVTVGVSWLAIAMFVGVTIRYQVPNPAELLADVAERPVPWMVSNVVLIVFPLALAVARPLLVGLAGGGSTGGVLVDALVALGGGALAFSGIAHGVFGAHLAARFRDGDPVDELVRLAEVVHALGDTGWFVGVGAMMAITALVTWGGRSRLERWMVLVGVGALVANALQFGWFFDHLFGLFAGPGTALQAAWFVGVGCRGTRGYPGIPPRPATHRP